MIFTEEYKSFTKNLPRLCTKETYKRVHWERLKMFGLDKLLTKPRKTGTSECSTVVVDQVSSSAIGLKLVCW